MTCEDCNWWVSADARGLRRMRLRMRLGRWGGLTLASSTAGILLGLTRGEVARKAGHAASRRQSASGCRETASH